MFIEILLRDIRFGLRLLTKSPGFAAIGVLIIALSIGSNTAIFTLLDGLILRDLSVPHPEQLVRFGAHASDNQSPLVSLPIFEEISRNQKVFSATFAWWSAPLSVGSNRSLSLADVWGVTGNYYSELGGFPEIGRLIGPADVDLNTATPVRVAVLGYSFWKRNYGGSKSILGKTINIEDTPFVIIGVVRRGFMGMSADTEPEITVPLTVEPLIFKVGNVQKHLQRSDWLWLDAGGRLKSRLRLAQARVQIDSIWPGIRRAVTPIQQTPAERANFLSLGFTVEADATGYSYARKHFARPVYMLLIISVAVMLIACINLGSLMISRAVARNHEVSIRIALGASRSRVVQQVLIESLLLSGCGTVVGFLIAMRGSSALAAFILGEIYIVPARLNLSPDWSVFGFTTVAAIVSGVLFGVAPAWYAMRQEPNVVLRQNSHWLGPSSRRLGRGLAVSQIALSLVLLNGTGLLIRSLGKLLAVQPGYRIKGVFDVSLFPKPNAFTDIDRVGYFYDLSRLISNLPGVTSAAVAHMDLGRGVEWTERIRVSGQNVPEFSADCGMVMPGFFRTEGISLLRGRAFAWQDDSRAPAVAIISDNLARRVSPFGDALGKRINVTTEPEWQSVEVVGIVSDASIYDVRKTAQPAIYLPTLQYGDYADSSDLLVRTNLPLGAISLAIRGAIGALGRENIMYVKPLAEQVNKSLLPERVTAWLSVFFSSLALLMAAIGLYGLMAHNVTRRTREFGVRVALGAQGKTILTMILSEALGLTLIGIVFGMPISLVTSRTIAHMLFGVAWYDPLTLAAVVITLLTVSLVAGYIPARRAMLADPMFALRHE